MGPICQLRRCGKQWPVEVDLIRRLPVEARMRPSAIIKNLDRNRSKCEPRIPCRSSEIGEWREALQPRALPEPDVNLAIHPAPIIQP